MEKAPHIILIGPPASGKGTISNHLVENYSYYQLSTGDLLREETLSGSKLGEQIAELIDNGKMVPNEISKQVMIKNLPKKQQIIFDGYPRNDEQVDILENDLLPSLNSDKENTIVFFINASLEVIEERIENRLSCSTCGKVFHLKNIPPKKIDDDFCCTKCDSPLSKRKDDNLQALPNRIKTYKEVTLPIIQRLKKYPRFYTIDSHQEIKKMIQEVLDIISEKK